MAYELLVDKADWRDKSDAVAADLDALAVAEPGWAGTISVVKADLLETIEKSSRKRPLVRFLKYYAAPFFVGGLVITYVSVWYYNDLKIDQKVETKTGIMQRAAAFDKAMRHVEWSPGPFTRGGGIVRLALTSIEPDDDEAKAAQEFVNLTLQGYQVLEQGKDACGLTLPSEGEALNEQQIALLKQVSSFVQDPKIAWRTPPVQTVLVPIANAYPCK